MKKRCSTCPLNKDENGRDQSPQIAAKVKNQCLTEASQICHHPRLHGKAESHLCRGARDFQLQIFHRLGILEEPTDESWEKAYSKRHV